MENKHANLSAPRKAKKSVNTITAVKVGGVLDRRIRDMGIVPGTRIIIMGDILTLRNSEADFIGMKTASLLKNPQGAKRTNVLNDTLHT